MFSENVIDRYKLYKVFFLRTSMNVLYEDKKKRLIKLMSNFRLRNNVGKSILLR